MARSKTIFERKQGEAFYPAPGTLGYVYLTSLGSEESEKAKAVANWAATVIPSMANSFSSEEKMTVAYSSLRNLI